MKTTQKICKECGGVNDTNTKHYCFACFSKKMGMDRPAMKKAIRKTMKDVLGL